MLEPFLKLGIDYVKAVVDFGNNIVDVGLKFGEERHGGDGQRPSKVGLGYINHQGDAVTNQGSSSKTNFI